MGQRRHHQNNRPNRAQAPPPVRAPLPVLERKPPAVSGKPFVLLEDVEKTTFIYSGGKWIPHSKSIAECREDSQVKQLPQKINGMTRYEVCAPLHASE